VTRERISFREEAKMTITGSCLCRAVSYEITGSFKAAGPLPLFDLQEVSRGGICDVGARQSGSVSLDIRRRISRAL
jgi:hypothetical protein